MLTAQVEVLSEHLKAHPDLIEKHYEELALDKEKVPLDPMWEVYLARDERGEVLFVTLREDGKIIGYFVGFVNPGLHYRSCLTLIMDIFYIDPDKRGGTGALRLFRAVEKEARRRGVKRWFCGTKLHKDAGRLFESLGFRAIETFYSKWLGA